jgi:hypothetical protein
MITDGPKEDSTTMMIVKKGRAISAAQRTGVAHILAANRRQQQEPLTWIAGEVAAREPGAA